MRQRRKSIIPGIPITWLIFAGLGLPGSRGEAGGLKADTTPGLSLVLLSLRLSTYGPWVILLFDCALSSSSGGGSSGGGSSGGGSSSGSSSSGKVSSSSSSSSSSSDSSSSSVLVLVIVLVVLVMVVAVVVVV